MTLTRPAWEKMVADWRTSGQPASKFAATRGVTETAFRYWSRRLGGKRGGVTAAPAPAPAPAPALARVVREKPTVISAARVVVLVGPAKIAVEPGFNAKHLRDVVRALGELA